MNRYLLILTFMLATSISCTRNTSRSDNNSDAVRITVLNPLEIPQTDALVEIDLKNLSETVNSESVDNFILTYDTVVCPFQLTDTDKDGNADKLLFVCSLKPGEKKIFSFEKPGEYREYDFIKRTQAELSVKTGGEWKENKYIGGKFENIQSLRVPPEHTDHSFFIRYEGPGWESDKVGYRFYLDWRNAIDIFGKKVDTMVLQNVGQDGFESYHEPAPWGMDILKVGSSLGLGSVGMWNNDKASRVEVTDSISCEIIENGIIQSIIKTKYYGWEVEKLKTDLTSFITINAGSRLTKHQLYLSEEADNLCTGIVKHDQATEILPDKSNGIWTYFATYGKQSLADDNLGMAIFYKASDLIELSEDEHSFVVILKPDKNGSDYYFSAAWEKENGGINNINEFREYLERTIILLNNPLKIKYQ